MDSFNQATIVKIMRPIIAYHWGDLDVFQSLQACFDRIRKGCAKIEQFQINLEGSKKPILYFSVQGSRNFLQKYNFSHCQWERKLSFLKISKLANEIISIKAQEDSNASKHIKPFKKGLGFHSLEGPYGQICFLWLQS